MTCFDTPASALHFCASDIHEAVRLQYGVGPLVTVPQHVGAILQTTPVELVVGPAVDNGVHSVLRVQQR